MKQFKYTQTFATKSIRIVYPEEKSIALASASLQALKGLVPESLKINENPDLLFNSFNAAVVNRINLNDDGIQTATAMRIYKNFVHKFCDLEHDRAQIVGSIITSGFSEFLTNRLITEVEAASLNTPFNICLGSVVWPLINSKFSDALVESSDETSAHFEEISASWEVGFDEMYLAVGSRDLSEAQIITDTHHIVELKKYLRMYGGAGITNANEPIYRVIAGDALPLGIGYTSTPAAAVKGVITIREQDTEATLKAEVEEFDKEEKEREVIEVNMDNLIEATKRAAQSTRDANISLEELAATLKKDEEIKNNSSQEEKNTVNNNSIMKFKSIEDITDESLQQSNAAAVKNFIGQQIANEIDKASEQYATELEAKENEVKTKQEEALRIQAQFEETRKQLEALTVELTQERDARASERAQAAFNSRMAELEAQYELGEKEIEIIAKRIRGLDDASYAEWLEEFGLFAGAKKKGFVPFKKKGEDEDEESDEDKKKKKKAAKASVEDALDEAEENEGVTPPNTPSIQQTVSEEFADAFKVEDFKIKTR